MSDASLIFSEGACDTGFADGLQNFKIVNNKLAINKIEIIFENDELTEILISSSPKQAELLDSLESDVIKIANEFNKKYGNPSFSFNEKINKTVFTKGDMFGFRSWEVGNQKNIFIYLGELEYGNLYYYLIFINNYNFPTIKKKVTFTEREKKQIKERKEKEEQEKYQF